MNSFRINKTLSVHVDNRRRLGIAFYLKAKINVSKPIKPVLPCSVLLVVAALVLSPVHFAKAENKAEDQKVKQRLDKIEEIEEKEETVAKKDEESFTSQKLFGEKVRLNGFIDLNYEYLDLEDIDDKDSGSSSDLFMRPRRR